MTRRTLIAVAIVALLAAGCAPKPMRMFGGGQYTVPDQIEPGTYVTTMAIQDEGAENACTWTRLGPNRTPIDEDYLSFGERGRVTVKASDVAVAFEGDCKWKRDAG